MIFGSATSRIRAVIRATAIKLSTAAPVFRASVVVPYIRIQTALGLFFKRLALVDQVAVSDTAVYFAEDYVELGYVAAPFYIYVGKAVVDPVLATDSLAHRVSTTLSETASFSDSILLLAAGMLNASDNPTVTDFGAVQAHDYCEIVYFSEDYLGQSRVFT